MSRRVRRELAAFVAVGLLAMTVIAVGATIIVRGLAVQQALVDRERAASEFASGIVAPLLGRGLAGDAASLQELRMLVEGRIGADTLIQVEVWSVDGGIVWSDQPGKVGLRFPPSDEVLAAITAGRTSAGIETELESEPAGERGQVEVYVPLHLPDRVLAFEAYYGTAALEAQTDRLLGQLVPLGIVSLVLVQLVQVPIAVSLARRVQRHEKDRARLLERALSASERERKEIAAGIHDGVVQDLAAVGYGITGLRAFLPPERHEMANRLGSMVRGSVEALRRLMVDIYPPDLSGAGLAAAMGELAEPLRAAGVTVDLDVDPLPPLSPDVAATLYRMARETLLNVAKHAGATTVRVRLAAGDGRAGEAVRLVVADDGVGLPPEGIDKRDGGHLGLRLLVDKIAELGGELTVATAPTGGTVADARVPTGRTPTEGGRSTPPPGCAAPDALAATS